MNIEQERERFEDAALAHFISQRAAGKAQDDNGGVKDNANAKFAQHKCEKLFT